MTFVFHLDTMNQKCCYEMESKRIVLCPTTNVPTWESPVCLGICTYAFLSMIFACDTHGVRLVLDHKCWPVRASAALVYMTGLPLHCNTYSL